jgi:CO/xanthine dehydrogenase Mo-binding subunit
MTYIQLSRRGLFKQAGALVVSFSLAGAIAQRALGQSIAQRTVDPAEVDSFLAIDGKGMVTVFSGKVDLGTGLRTAMTQIVADELDVPFEHVAVIEGDTALTPDQGVTYGSLGVQNGGVQIRQAAATARKAILTRAAEKLGAPADQLTIEKGMVKAKSGKSVTIGDVISGRSFSLKIDAQAPIKPPEQRHLVGTPVKRLDIPAKVTGRFTYMQDFRLPDMLHGRVVRPPAIGAILQSVDESSVADVPGVVKVVRQGNFLGVVAKTEWGAIKAMRQLKATWSDWQGLPEQAKLWESVRNTKVVKEESTSKAGDVDAALAGAAKKLKATYDFAVHTHGSIGPSCAVAEFKDGQLTCWSASQGTHNLRKQLANMLSLPETSVRCVYIDGSGCYGRNGHEDAAADAVLLAKAVGKPVRVQWMREDEHGWDPKGPPTLIDIEGGLDGEGKPVAWRGTFMIPQGAAGMVPLVAASLADLPHEMTDSPGGIQQDSAITYAIPNIQTNLHRLEHTPFRPSWIRSPGRMQNSFANESFLDEMAMAAGRDPLEFRRSLLSDARGLELLDRLEHFANWQKRTGPATQSGDIARGTGISYIKYELVRTYVAVVAEVEVNRKTGQVTVPKFFVVHDCGQIINPDGVKAQIEGNVIQTVSRTLKEEVTFDRSKVTSTDWSSYPILTFPEVPEVVMELIDRPTEKPWGAGEPTAALVPSAIGNAIFHATGARLRSVPFTPEKVKAALQSV